MSCRSGLFALDQAQGVAVEPDFAFIGAEFANEFDFPGIGELEGKFQRSPVGVSDEFVGSFAAGDANARARADIAGARRNAFGRGERNEPANVMHTLAVLAEARGEDAVALAAQIDANATEVFGL